jgi:hypothetical protein
MEVSGQLHISDDQLCKKIPQTLIVLRLVRFRSPSGRSKEHKPRFVRFSVRNLDHHTGYTIVDINSFMTCTELLFLVISYFLIT